MPIGLVTGLESEAALARRYLPAESTGFIACEGPGPEAARSAALRLIDQDVNGLISFGYAGGIDRELKAGDLIIATEIRAGRDKAIACTPTWSETLARKLGGQLRVVRAPIAASDTIIETTAEKLKLHYKTGAAATDMESLAVAEVATEAGIAFATLRAVIDTAGQDLPPMAVVAAGPDGKLKPWRILWSLIRQPGQIPALRPLTLNSKLAERTLGKACRLAGPDFART